MDLLEAGLVTKNTRLGKEPSTKKEEVQKLTYHSGQYMAENTNPKCSPPIN
jgi:hypothetical protein